MSENRMNNITMAVNLNLSQALDMTYIYGRVSAMHMLLHQALLAVNNTVQTEDLFDNFQTVLQNHVHADTRVASHVQVSPSRKGAFLPLFYPLYFLHTMIL